MKEIVLKSSKGISIIFLIVAMLLMVIIGYVFSYLIPTKQKSVSFVIQSTQAFFIAQSGVEFAIRYALDNNWRTRALLNANLNGVTRPLGNGSFSLTYTAATNTLNSIGQVPTGTERRRIAVVNFTRFLQRIVLWIDPANGNPTPCLTITTPGGNYQYEATFYMRDTDPINSPHITLNSFRATWDNDPITINRIRFDNSNVFTSPPNYANGDPQTSFDNDHTVQDRQTHRVRIRWAQTTVGTYDFSHLIVYFYDTDGNEYAFALDPDGNGLPGC